MIRAIAIAPPPAAIDRSSGSGSAQRRARNPRHNGLSATAVSKVIIRLTLVRDSPLRATLLWVIRTTMGAVADSWQNAGNRVIHTAKAMLPSLRIILAAVI